MNTIEIPYCGIDVFDADVLLNLILSLQKYPGIVAATLELTGLRESFNLRRTGEMRNTLPPLQSNELFGPAVIISSFFARQRRYQGQEVFP